MSPKNTSKKRYRPSDKAHGRRPRAIRQIESDRLNRTIRHVPVDELPSRVPVRKHFRPLIVRTRMIPDPKSHLDNERERPAA